jgi:4-alpha-glucanotransferase
MNCGALRIDHVMGFAGLFLVQDALRETLVNAKCCATA